MIGENDDAKQQTQNGNPSDSSIRGSGHGLTGIRHRHPDRRLGIPAFTVMLL
jgi:hypothetical protein